MNQAGYDKDVGAIVLAGAGDRAFCTGGDQSAHDGNYDGRGTIGLPMEELHAAIRDVPKPVIARVQGYAIGGGNVLCTICDLTIASDKAIFGQVGPKMGSVDPGYGTAFLARVVGEKKAREIWYLCRRYSGQEAVAMGLANVGVPHDQLDAEVQKWARGDLRAQPDRDRHRQAQLQHGHRPSGRHRRHGHVCAEALLRHRRIARGRQRLQGKAQARIPQIREVNSPREGRTLGRWRAFRRRAPAPHTTIREDIDEPLSRRRPRQRSAIRRAVSRPIASPPAFRSATGRASSIAS